LDISPLANGRFGLLVLSTSMSNISLSIILFDITKIVLISEIMNFVEDNNLENDGFIIYPPEKNKRIVGKILLYRISFKKLFTLLNFKLGNLGGISINFGVLNSFVFVFDCIFIKFLLKLGIQQNIVFFEEIFVRIRE
jgi:hypothetical protein